MRRIGLVGIVSFILALQGCATLSESECENAEWRTIGLEDGSKGRLETYVSRHREACAEYGVKPDLGRYRLGHAEGLLHFCTPQNGFRYGDSGRSYNGACPADLEDGFLLAYERGRELYLLREDISQMQREVRAAEAELEEINDRIVTVEAQLVGGGGTVAQRQAWISEMNQLQYDRGQLETIAHGLELDAARRQGEYDVLSSRYQY